MIQLLGLRSYWDAEKQEERVTDNTFFKRGWKAPSVVDLFANLELYLGQVPEADRWNLYYTSFDCGERKREFKSRDIIPFDIDNADESRVPEYIETFSKLFELDPGTVGQVWSGGGLQLIVGTTSVIGSVEKLQELKRHYLALVGQLQVALQAAGLPGEVDKSVWDHKRLLRLPGTENRSKKPGRKPAAARLLQGIITRQDFDITTRSGLPLVNPEDQIDERAFKSGPAADVHTVLKECLFLNHCKENPNEIHEPEWYAALSILGRLDQDGALAHQYSQGHRGYDPEETSRKLVQALEASGPRTCKGIAGLWGGCSSCPHFGKVTSPIVLRGPDYIPTEGTGFHHRIYDEATGELKKTIPSYEDLLKFFDRLHHHKTCKKRCLIWQENHYVEMDEAELEGFAQDHFKPYPDSKKTSEFRLLVKRTGLKKPEWFVETTSRKMNFRNGVLDLMSMAFTPHSPDSGFQYVLDYDYTPQATAPGFEKFVLEIMGGCEKTRDVLMEFLGYALSNDECWAQMMAIFVGGGSNGKSTLIDIFQMLAGKANYRVLTTKNLKNNFMKQMLDGALFNISEEVPRSKHATDWEEVKNLAAGGAITVEKKNKDPYTLRNRAKFIFTCNALADSEDLSHGFFRRLLIIPFDQEFSDEKGNKIVNLRDHLVEELPGIFNLCIAAYKRLLKQRRFTESPKVVATLQEYKRDLDNVLRWYEHCCTVQPVEPDGRFSTVPDLYAHYRQECERAGERPLTNIAWGKRMAKLVPDYDARRDQKKINGEKQNIVRGVLLNSAAQY